jgi:hypothetical protein
MEAVTHVPHAARPLHPTRLLKAEAAWNRVLRGEVHETKGCERCGGCLEIERFRLCASCVEAENAERQLILL